MGVLMLPAGRSGHLELGQIMGDRKPGFILLDEDYDRWDVMYRKAVKSGGGVFWANDIRGMAAKMTQI